MGVRCVKERSQADPCPDRALDEGQGGGEEQLLPSSLNPLSSVGPFEVAAEGRY